MILPELQVVAQVFAERILNTAVEGIVLVDAGLDRRGSDRRRP